MRSVQDPPLQCFTTVSMPQYCCCLMLTPSRLLFMKHDDAFVAALPKPLHTLYTKHNPATSRL
jgi:hypothetical protein